jgi:hypothetical protein
MAKEKPVQPKETPKPKPFEQIPEKKEPAPRTNIPPKTDPNWPEKD